MLQKMEAEILYFAWSILAGASIAIGSMGMSWLHRHYRQKLWLGILDLLYWFLVGGLLFLLCYHQNSGVLRGYAVLGNLLGYVVVQMAGKCTEKGIARRRKKG